MRVGRDEQATPLGKGIMNRRDLFLSSAKAALLGALGGIGLTGAAKAQPANAATGWASKIYHLIGKVTGAPGSPTATLNIPGDQLPPPPQPFGGSDRTQRGAVEALLADARRPA